MASKKTAAKKTSGKPKNNTRKAAAKMKESEVKKSESHELRNQIVPYILAFAAIFLTICLLAPDLTGDVGALLRSVLLGLFSAASALVPALILLQAVFYKKDVEYHALRYKFVFSLIVLLFTSVLVHVLTGGEMLFQTEALYENGQSLFGGGVVGGLTGSVLYKFFGYVGTVIISLFFILLFGIFLFGLTPHMLYVRIAYSLLKRREQRSENKDSADIKSNRQTEEKEAEIRRMRETYARQKKETESHKKHAALDKNIYSADSGAEAIRDGMEAFAEETSEAGDSDHGSSGIDRKEDAAEISDSTETVSDAELLKPLNFLRKKSKTSEDCPTGEIDLQAIFETEQDASLRDKYGVPQAMDASAAAPQAVEFELAVKKSRIEDGLEPLSDAENSQQHTNESPQPPVYRFPPISLLKHETNAANLDVSAELNENAQKLVDTLRSFRVQTRIIHISRGPTITRYELAPEAGTRVRSISNLVDDISLNLATSGVRIESPIPGKSAVGIEVPNKNVATVYVRDLIESDAFRRAQSKLTTCLGMDVAGAPVFLDIAKMPHLLIAGATGMGKSVCINSLLISILYKSTPEEVKLILIDPKKVELNIYNGIPHLLVPVVSDPKKAAGALHWAVTEMERRFELIEEVGVRDIRAYNEVTKNDPEKEKMAQIVIIIDELADLMMTAPDEVEESICRLAQKARAAGMHLIIGTQRPSVDVITGLIKANIPSRIAFTVASQVDSRTIIDISGAEKLIGRGDMLFAPVGLNKPVRVQGAFVSENEVEAVTEFLKKTAGQAEYADDVMERIEKEAELCGQKKGRGASAELDGDDSEGDPMLRSAIELAVDSGKISTSLIQRRLSLGYGRAAKLIDKMEQMGIVSPPEGQKPRTVLITKQQYMEMVVQREELG